MTINPLSSLSGSSACLTLDAARKLVAAANGQDETPVVQVSAGALAFDYKLATVQ